MRKAGLGSTFWQGSRKEFKVCFRLHAHWAWKGVSSLGSEGRSCGAFFVQGLGEFGRVFVFLLSPGSNQKREPEGFMHTGLKNVASTRVFSSACRSSSVLSYVSMHIRTFKGIF